MGKASLLTPVYFFSSMRAGSGKSTMLANLSIYLNNTSQRIAIVDLDADTPLKLKSTFPRSISLQEYSDISLISQHQDSRYQKNFYFTETSLISYFPAHKLKDASMLFSDTTLRDFFIQITACFDTVMVNFPSGPQHARQASLLLARQHLWRGKSPLSIIVSQADEKSLVSLDALIQENPAFYYQLQENTLLLFNRVPATVEDQKLAENTLNGLELRSLFNFPTTYTVGISEEFSYQRQAAAPLVLDHNSVIHQTISSLFRMLTGTVRGLGRTLYEQTSDYQPCLDGQLLEKLSPYLDKIQSTSARRLFQHPSDIQVFLEESDGNYRIRIRLTGVRQPLAGIQRTIDLKEKHALKDRLSPAIWPFRINYQLPETEDTALKQDRPALSVKPVYRFDDRFASSVDCRLRCDFDFLPTRGRYPSPILFRPNLDMPEIPSLSEVLGYMRKQFKKSCFAPDKEPELPGVTHFFIPPEFDLATSYFPVFLPEYSMFAKRNDRRTMRHALEFTPAFQLHERNHTLLGNLPDIFARNMPVDAESRFTARVSCLIPQEFTRKTALLQSPRHTSPIISTGIYLTRGDELPKIHQQQIPPIIYISASAAIGMPDSKKRLMRPQDHNWRDCFDLRNDNAREVALSLKPSTDLIILDKSKSTLISDHFKFTFTEEAKTFRASIFEKTGILSPATFALDNANPAKESYLGYAELKLPSTFKLEDVMVDHRFLPTVYKLAHKSSLNNERSSRLYCFDYAVFFRQPFTELVHKGIKKHLTLDRADISHHFVAAGSDYHNLAYRKSSSLPALRDQILKTTFVPKPLKNYRDISNLQSTRNDVILDAGAQIRKFPPVKGRITDIRVMLARPPVPGHLLSEKRIRPAATLKGQKPVYRQLSCRKLPEKFSATIAPHLVQIITGHDVSYRMPAARTYKSDSLQLSSRSSVFAIASPDLYTLSIRIGSRQIYHAVSTSLKDRIDITAMIETTRFDYQHIYSERFVEPVFRSILPSFGDCPLRTRKIEWPNLLEFPVMKAESEVLDHESQIIFSADNTFTANCSRHSKGIWPACSALHMVRQSLPKSAARTWKKIEAGKKHFRALFPDSIETLYRHLLWSLAVKRQQAVSFSAAHLARAAEPRRAFKTGNAVISQSASFCLKGTEPTGKLSQNFLRSAVKVSKLRLKDVMSLARQASEKFSQVNSRLQA